MANVYKKPTAVDFDVGELWCVIRTEIWCIGLDSSGRTQSRFVLYKMIITSYWITERVNSTWILKSGCKSWWSFHKLKVIMLERWPYCCCAPFIVLWFKLEIIRLTLNGKCEIKIGVYHSILTFLEIPSPLFIHEMNLFSKK